MLISERDKKICEKFSARDEDGKVHCFECPLVLVESELMCRANCHYDRHMRGWIFDDWRAVSS